MTTRPPSGDVTRWIRKARHGDQEALQKLLPVVYDELRRIAQLHLNRERGDHTLGSTALVHEAYVRLAGGRVPDVNDRAHFFGIAARSMRQVLVDHARARAAVKRGGAWERTSITNKDMGMSVPIGDMIDLDEALAELGEFAPRLLRVVELRFFAGLEESEVAELLDVSKRTVQRDWVAARAWLYRELRGSPGVGDETVS